MRRRSKTSHAKSHQNMHIFYDTDIFLPEDRTTPEMPSGKTQPLILQDRTHPGY